MIAHTTLTLVKYYSLRSIRVTSQGGSGPSCGALPGHGPPWRRATETRIRKMAQIGKWYVHQLHVSSVEELDDEVLGWLQEAHRVGEQPYLDASQHVGSKR